MLEGIGVDVVALERFRAYESRWDDPFFTRIFTPRERAEAATRDEPLRFFAGRFAVKEAVVKACNAHGVRVEFPQVETVTNEHGAPVCALVDADGAPLPESAGLRIHVSITHEEAFSIAIAAVERA